MGKLRFSPRKVLLEVGEEEYFVRPFSLRSGYVHGDIVRARITKSRSGERFPEAEVTTLVERSNEVLLATVFYRKGKILLDVKKEQGVLQIPLSSEGKKYAVGDILAIKFTRDGTIRILEKFAHDGDYDLEERLLLFLGNVRTDFPAGVLEEGKSLMKMGAQETGLTSRNQYSRHREEGSDLVSENRNKTASFLAVTKTIETGETTPLSILHTSNASQKNVARNDRAVDSFDAFRFDKLEKSTLLSLGNIFDSKDGRIDFRNWYTLTIDGADAKDLDDAISIASYHDGGFLLAVHIADVAEYVREHSQLDKEALLRATSIYTPGRVIPMLPEVLSNDLCSLHPGSPKNTLTCLMNIDVHGKVRHTEIVEGIIESQKKGVYEEIMNYKLGITSDAGGKSFPSSGMKGRIQEATETTGFFASSEGREMKQFHTMISLAFDLYETLKKRRQKEGKIIFESTEMNFQFEGGSLKGEEKKMFRHRENGSDLLSENRNKTASFLAVTEKTETRLLHPSPGQKPNIPTSIMKRERNDAHMMIEEFMVLANEEVAKWCVKHELPFLSRVHGLPARENIGLIATIIDNIEAKKKLEPHHIREYMERITDPVEQFRLSRLLLPKMAKATYADSPFRHFGLALSFYSHFTSPIRRYPDLQVHRIIKETLHGQISSERKAHYRNLLKKVARLSSERERAAQDIERAFDALYMCRYMQDKVGKTYDGRISGITEYALYVELPSGVEGTIFLPRKKLFVNPVTGSLENAHGKELYRIGQALSVVVDGVNMEEKRIIFAEKEI